MPFSDGELCVCPHPGYLIKSRGYGKVFCRRDESRSSVDFKEESSFQNIRVGLIQSGEGPYEQNGDFPEEEKFCQQTTVTIQASVFQPVFPTAYPVDVGLA